jgi:hypothetical protein
MTSLHRRAVVVAMAAVVSNGLAACGSSSISASDVASKAKDALNPQLAAIPNSLDSVSCPNDLAAKVGASETCTGVESRGAKVRITATVASVSGSNANLNFKIVGLADSSSPTPGTTT